MLGYAWLSHHNPLVDWQAGALTFQSQRWCYHCDVKPDPAPVAKIIDIEQYHSKLHVLDTPEDVEQSQYQAHDIQHQAYVSDLPEDSAYESVCSDSPSLELPLRKSVPSPESSAPPVNIAMTGAAPFASLVNKGVNVFAITAHDIDKYLKEKPYVDPKTILPPEYHDLVEVFNKARADVLPPHRENDHRIDLEPGIKPSYFHLREYSQAELQCVKKYVDDNLAKGFVRKSNSPASSPILLAKRPGGGIRICVDYRGLNQITIKTGIQYLVLPLPLPFSPWSEIAVDFVVDLPPSTQSDTGLSFRNILTVPDRFTKECILIPVISMTAIDTARAFVRHVFSKKGMPSAVTSDRGPQFVSDFWNHLCDDLEIEQRLSSGYHPETDGQSERTNQSMK